MEDVSYGFSIIQDFYFWSMLKFQYLFLMEYESFTPAYTFEVI